MAYMGTAYYPAYYAPTPYGYYGAPATFAPPLAPPYSPTLPPYGHSMPALPLPWPVMAPPAVAQQSTAPIAAPQKPQASPPPLTIKEVKASHILVKTREEALRYRQQILSGQARFEDIAQKASKCPSGKEGGDLGIFERGQMVPAFDKAAFTLPVGVLSEPIKTDFGWHLIKVTEQR